MRLARILAAVVVATASLTTQAASFTFASFGDMPYREADWPKYERLIGAINGTKPAFTVHIGDIKSGSSPCDDTTFLRVRDSFARFEAPLVYTPGDNEWTDCHREAAGKYDPLERLATLRRMFFVERKSLGGGNLPLVRQSEDSRFATYVENVRWQREGVVFATLHVIGSNNNLQRNRDAANEYFARNEANLAWLQAAFAEARKPESKGLVIFMQADLMFDIHEDQRTGLADMLRTLRNEGGRLNKPVLLVHGDAHRFIVDKPFANDSKRTLTNMTRLQVFGDNELGAVLVNVDTDRPGLFSFTPLLLDEQR